MNTVTGFWRAPGVASLMACLMLAGPATAEVIKLSSPSCSLLRGYVYVDLNRNAELEIGEAVINNVVVQCTMTATLGGGPPTGGYPTYETTTDERGHYCFNGLQPGVYSVTYVSPVQFLPGTGAAPGTGATYVGTCDGPNDVEGIRLAAGDMATMYNFGTSGLRSAYVSKRSLLTYGGKVDKYEGDIPVVIVPEPAIAMLAASGWVVALVGSRAAGARRRRR